MTLFLNGQPQVDEATLAKLAKCNVTTEATPLSRLEGSTPELTGVHLTDGLQGKIIRVDSSKQTTISGVFAAGDTTQVMNATLASADGVMAGAYLHRALIFEMLET